jgi:AcrR family transcriptional regulator
MAMETENAQSGNSTEQRLLDAGIEMWADADPATVFGGFTVSRVAKAAGVTRATFYSYWSTPEEYLRALLAHLDTRRPYQDTSRVPEDAIASRSDDNRVLNRFMEACNRRFVETVASPGVRVRLGFASKMDDPEIADGLRMLYRNYEDDTQLLNRELRERWGREPRPPFTDEWIQSIFAALLDGIALRHVIDPERMPIESFGLVGAMLMTIATRATDDPREIDDMLGAINQWPATGARLASLRRVEDALTTQPLSGSTLDATVVLARRLLADGNWETLDVDDIALAAGIDADRLLRTFGSKTGIALAIIALNAAEQWEETPRSDDPLTDLRTLLDIIVMELRRSPSLGQSVIQILSGSIRIPDPAIFNRAPIPDITRLLAEAQARGQIIDSIDLEGFSTSLTRIMLAEGAPATLTGLNRVDSLGYILEGIRVRR